MSARAAGAKRVVAFAQRRHDIGEGLQRPYHALDERRSDQQQVEKQAADEEQARRLALLRQELKLRG